MHKSMDKSNLMEEKGQDLEELAEIAEMLSPYSRGLIIATARGALFGEQAVQAQYGPSTGTPGIPKTGKPGPWL
jgi:hypothetical protein